MLTTKRVRLLQSLQTETCQSLNSLEQSGTYSACNHDFRIGVVVVCPDARTAEVTCYGADGDFDVTVDCVHVWEDESPES